MTAPQQQPQQPPQGGSGPGLALLIILVPAVLFLMWAFFGWLVAAGMQDMLQD